MMNAFPNGLVGTAHSTNANDGVERLPLREYGLILVQLALLAVLVWQFHLEERRHLLAGLLMAAGGFAVHALLPFRLRRAWFILLSVAAVVLVLGLEQAAYVVGLGAALIGVAVLPAPLAMRIGVMLLCTGGLVWLRRDSDAMFWPIVGSMFMFRMIVYLQSVRRERPLNTLSETVSYFFLFPNAFFPLFPVVDYDTFRQTYYNDERRTIYQTGVHWMAVGVTHLLLYRLIRYELIPAPLEIRTLRDAVQFLAMNYALYLRISGHFHLICGMLHLFGYNLPRTHDGYFLASSFSDIWRRINIYWKDFMMKSFFFPAFFRTRAAGNVEGVILAVLWVFLWTWLLHSWQVFWLLGDFPFRWHDGLLWLGVGAVVAANGVVDYLRASRSAAPPAFSFLRAARHSLQVVGVFCCVSLFWAQWGNPEVFRMLVYSITRGVMPVTTRDVVFLASIAAGAVAVGVAAQFLLRHPAVQRFRAQPLNFERSAAWHLAPLMALLLLTQPPVSERFGTDVAKFIAGLQVERLSRGEALAMIDGYYEELNEKTLQSGPFLRDPAPRRSADVVDFGDMVQRRDDMQDHELIPNWQGTWHGAAMTTNRWGMRDRDRSIVKPLNTTRVAVVGSSLVMGYGVNDDETFTRLMEARLNAEINSGSQDYEVLNFGVGRYSPLHRRLQIERKVLPFQPDLIVYVAHQDEMYTSTRHIGPALHHGLKLDDPCLEQVVVDTGIRDYSSEALMQIQLDKHHVDILQCIYARMQATARSAHAQLLCAYVPIPGAHELPFDPRICLKMAADAGMDTADLSDWEGDRKPEDVLVAPRDHHPNALGHRLLADAMALIVRTRLRRAAAQQDDTAGPP
jgi:hypothetical protein